MDEDFLKQLQDMANTPCSISGELTEDAIQFADSLESYIEQDLSQPHIMPAYLKEQIKDRAAQPDIQQMKNSHCPKKKRSKQLELFLYSCKVAGAVAAALVMMCTTTFTNNALQKNTFSDNNKIVSTGITKNLQKGSSAFTSWLQDLSDSIMNGGKQQTHNH